MGKMISKVYSSATREVKMYNIEKRAENIISKDKPTPAPKYPSTLLEIERLNKENVSKEYLHKKDIQLDDNLKKVYVTTPSIKLEEPEVKSDRPLPLSRFTYNDSLYGYSESEERLVPEGRLSLKQAVKLIADHRSDPKKFSNTTIAAEYKLPITLTDDILEHFKMFDLHYRNREHDLADQSSYMKLVQRAKEINMLNVSQVTKELPFFKKKKFFGSKREDETKKEENISVNIDSNNNEKQKDEKDKR